MASGLPVLTILGHRIFSLLLRTASQVACDYGLVPLGTTNFQHFKKDNIAFIADSVTFTLTGFTGSLSDITDVCFQYGTGLDEPNFVGIPQPWPYRHDADP